MPDDTSSLTKLGSTKTEYSFGSPDFRMLETFQNQYPDRDYTVSHITSEFTSLCPKTGQPDFATIEIAMIPDQLCVESKSLKLYLFAYRNEGSFMETIVNKILCDLVFACHPRYCKVTGRFNARGGINTSVVAEHSGP